MTTIELDEKVRQLEVEARLRNELDRVTAQRDAAISAGWDLAMYGTPNENVSQMWTNAGLAITNLMKEVRDAK